MSSLLSRIARAASTHWKRSLAISIGLLVALGALTAAAGGGFSDDLRTPGTDSQAAIDLLDARFPAQAGDSATVVFAVEDGTLRGGGNAAAVSRTVAAIERQPHVSSVAPPEISPDGRTAFATVRYDERAADLGREAGERLEEAGASAERSGVDFAMRGEVFDQAQQQSAPIGELIGIAVAVLVLTLVFRSFVAMTITLVAAGLSLAAGLLLLTLAGSATTMPTVAPTLGVMLGLGAGIDYALLIVGRYREQLAAGDSPPDAAARAGATAGVTVLAAGAIVVVAISGLLATGIPFVGRMGLGSAIVVATVAVGAVTLLPVLMGAAARRLKPADAAPATQIRALGRLDQRLTRRPWAGVLVGGALLLALAAPALDMRLGQPDDGNDAAGSTTRVAYDRLADGFGPGFNGPLQLAVELPRSGDERALLERVESAASGTDGVASVAPAVLSPGRDAAVINVIPTTSPQDSRTSELVERLRESTLPDALRGTGAVAHVGGATAVFDDLAGKIADRLPIFVAAVVGLSILLLIAVFRSVLVPLVSAGFNILSIGAAYGVVTAVFQWGWGSGLLGVDGSVPVVSFVPLLMFALLFGLSMDYNVFLLSRVREEYLKGASARDSILIGLARVARMILAAGAIMSAVFLGFVTDDEVIVKMFGLGLAAAIVVDVLVVRMILAPAALMLLGERAWWFPRWLDRIVPRVSLEGAT
jgi:putative drug exporter of the RND superfamily